MPCSTMVDSYVLPVLGSKMRPLHFESLAGLMLIRICSPFWFDLPSTEYPQRLAPHCSIRILPSFSSVSLQPQMVILGSMSLGGNIVPVENLAESLQVAFDAGAKRILLPMASVKDIPTIPGELFAKFQTGFYADASDAVFKALGVG